MPNREIYAQIADVVHPVEDWDIGLLAATIGRDADEMIAEADRARAEFTHNLMLRCDGDTHREHIGYVEPEDPDDPNGPFYGEGPDDDHSLPDPLIEALRDITGEINTLRARQRDLIAYAREFAPPGHSYTLEAIADAVGMSFSGVRTSFNDITIANVARNLDIGARKRGALQDPRWIAARDAILAAAEPRNRRTPDKTRAGKRTRPGD